MKNFKVQRWWNIEENKIEVLRVTIIYGAIIKRIIITRHSLEDGIFKRAGEITLADSINYSNSCFFHALLVCSLFLSYSPYFSFHRYTSHSQSICRHVFTSLSLLSSFYINLQKFVFLPSIFTSGKWPSSTILSASSTIKNRMPLMSRNIGISSSVISSHKRPGVATKICTGRLWLAP